MNRSSALWTMNPAMSVFLVVALLVAPSTAIADRRVGARVLVTTPTNDWCDFYSEGAELCGEPLPVGTVIDAYDPQGVHCGTFTVQTAGQWGLMHVYGDDPLTGGVDEGASPGDTLRFTIDGEEATVIAGDPTWTSKGREEVRLDRACQPVRYPVADVDADRRTDMTIWRPSNGKWYMLKSGTTPEFDYYQASSLTWGKPGDIPLLGDVDGDGQGDLIVWRPSNGKWYLLYSSTDYDYYQAKSYTWGKTGDIPLLGDIDGDRKDDLIVWRNLLWKVALSSKGYSQWMERGWGKTGDIPMPCPWCPSAADLPLPCLWCTP